MFDGKRVLALIPARGGSKGLPGKNIRNLGGKPLIAWTIEAARGSSYIDEVVVSTDDDDIAEIAKQAGAKTPFLRPPQLATDQAKSFDVVLHALDWYQKQGCSFDLILLLQPTSPLRTTADIDRAFEVLQEKSADAVVSVCETDHHPWWSNTLPSDGSMKEFLRPEVLNTNRQGLPKHFRLNGALYLATTDFLRRTNSFFGEQTFALEMPPERSIDIDTLLDFKIAEYLISTQSETAPSP